MDQQAVPSWLPGFLEPAKRGDNPQAYFAECKEHDHHNAKSRAPEQNVSKKACKNYYCVHCVSGPFCETKYRDEHTGHTVLQVRKSSHTDAIRISDISRLVGIDDIQRYSINGAKIVMLPSRPKIKPPKGSPSYCEECTRNLADQGVRFCSLECKMIRLQGRPKDESLRMAGGMQSGEEQSPTTGDALLRPVSPSPAWTVKRRARSSSKKNSFAPAAPMVRTRKSVLDLLDRANASSPPSLPALREDFNSRDSLETRYLESRKRSREGVPTPAWSVGSLSEKEREALEGLEAFITIKNKELERLEGLEGLKG